MRETVDKARGMKIIILREIVQQNWVCFVKPRIREPCSGARCFREFLCGALFSP
jgi:hypothetical protein